MPLLTRVHVGLSLSHTVGTASTHISAGQTPNRTSTAVSRTRLARRERNGRNVKSRPLVMTRNSRECSSTHSPTSFMRISSGTVRIRTTPCGRTSGSGRSKASTTSKSTVASARKPKSTGKSGLSNSDSKQADSSLETILTSASRKSVNTLSTSTRVRIPRGRTPRIKHANGHISGFPLDGPVFRPNSGKDYIKTISIKRSLTGDFLARISPRIWIMT